MTYIFGVQFQFCHQILNAVFWSFALQTSNCCLQIRFYALNFDVQISVFKLRSINSVFQIPFSRVLYPVSHLGYSRLGYRVFRQKKTERSKWQMKSIPKLQNCSEEQSRYSHRSQVLTSNYCDSGASEGGMAMRSVVNFRSLFAPYILSTYVTGSLKLF